MTPIEGRRTATATLVLGVAAAFLLVGCEDTGRFLEVTFVNHTDTDLRIYVSVDPRASVPAGQTVTADIDGRGCSNYVSARTEDGAFVAEPPGELCSKDTWTIEQSDLVPVPDGAAPSQSSSP